MNLLKRIFGGAPKQAKEQLFDQIIGYSDVKEVLSLAISSRDPVNIAFIGPPASSKTLFLLDICNRFKEQSHFIDGARASKVGIFDYLIQYRPKYLCVDELDKLPKIHQSALLNLMETGILSVTIHKKIQKTQLKCWVFATINDGSKILGPLKSRFQIFHLPEYTRDQFIEIGTKLLTRKGIDAVGARTITEIVYDQMDVKDPRQVIRLGNMMNSIDTQKLDMQKLRRIVSTCIKYGAPP